MGLIKNDSLAPSALGGVQRRPCDPRAVVVLVPPRRRSPVVLRTTATGTAGSCRRRPRHLRVRTRRWRTRPKSRKLGTSHSDPHLSRPDPTWVQPTPHRHPRDTLVRLRLLRGGPVEDKRRPGAEVVHSVWLGSS